MTCWPEFLLALSLTTILVKGPSSRPHFLRKNWRIWRKNFSIYLKRVSPSIWDFMSELSNLLCFLLKRLSATIIHFICPKRTLVHSFYPKKIFWYHFWIPIKSSCVIITIFGKKFSSHLRKSPSFSPALISTIKTFFIVTIFKPFTSYKTSLLFTSS